MLKLIKATIIFCVVAIWIIPSNAQELPKILPPSPEVYEITKYGDLPINESTGLANIEVPILDYSLGRIEVPIYFNYTTSGVKVNQLSSSIGLGWNLHAGGVITRIVKDVPDGDASYRIFPNPSEVESMKNSPDMIDYYSFIEDVGDTDKMLNDSEPDIYNYSFGKYTGSFIIDEDNVIRLVRNEDNLVVDKTPTGGFVLTDLKGLKYYFENQEVTEVINSCSHGVFGSPVDESVSGWFLSRIVALNGDEVTFTYKDTDYYFTYSFSQSVSKNSNIVQGTASTCSVNSNFIYSNCRNVYYYTTKTIESISNNRNYEKVVFHSVADREDLLNHSGVYRIHNIQLLNGSEVLRNFELEQGYVQSNKNYVHEDQVIRDPENKMRLFLNGVHEKMGAQKSNVYKFTYEDASGLPPRLSYSQDGLGYYNGITSQSMIPGFESEASVPQIFQGITFGDRRANFNYVTKGILKKVVYPTGGETEFVYEPQMGLTTRKSYYQMGSFGLVAEEDGSGLATCSQSNSFVPEYTERVRIDVNNYLLGEGLDLIHDRSLIIITNLTKGVDVLNVNLGLGDFNFDVDFVKGDTYQITVDLCSTVKEDHMISELYFPYIAGEIEDVNLNGTGVRIAKVVNRDMRGGDEVKVYHYGKKETIGEKHFKPFSFKNNYYLFRDSGSTCEYLVSEGPGVTRENTFQTSSIFSNNIDPIVSNYNQTVVYPNVTIGIGENFEGGIVEKNFQVDASYNYVLHGEVIKGYNIPNNSLLNGRLLSEVSYKIEDGVFKKVRSKEYFYNTESYVTKKIYAYQGNLRYYDLKQVNPNNSGPYNAAAINKLDVSRYEIDCGCNQLDRLEEKEYFDEGIVEKVVNYYYENENCGLRSRSVVTSSSGKVITEQVFYPQDIPVAERSTSESKLIDQHRIAEPIEVKTIVQNGSTVVSSNEVRKQFKHWGNNIVSPELVLTAKGAEGLEPRLVYQSYDSYGNPQEVSKVGGPSIVYLWGYNYTKPIAKIENSTLSEVKQILGRSINDDLSYLQNFSNDQIRSEIKILRDGLTRALVTTYTYRPLVGAASITDPRGKTVYYEYDDFNRLQFIKDQDQNILEEYQYNYASE